MSTSHIRNFCIIAHIDHGKSTLADRFLEVTGTISKREMKHEQMLDTMELEQERGITIKLQPVRMSWKHSGQGEGARDQKLEARDFKSPLERGGPEGRGVYLEGTNTQVTSGQRSAISGQLGQEADSRQLTAGSSAPSPNSQLLTPSSYQLNLIDTPGHVDFQYEVSRSLAACEGAILVVDATQGIEAQTLSNTYLALEHNLTIIPVINKIDLPAADVEKVTKELVEVLGIKPEEVIPISAKEGTNVDKVLDRIVELVPPPSLHKDAQEVKALIFDSVYDNYKGVVTYMKVVSGSIKRGDTMYLLSNHQKMEVLEVGYFSPKYKACDTLGEGEIGYIVTGLKSVRDAKVGDTIWKGADLNTAVALPGYKKVVPLVFASVFPIDGEEYPALRDSMEKLSLNDSSFTFEPDNSPALGHGFRCGFLGLLHMEIVQERLEREYDLNLIVTAPSVSYKIITIKDEEVTISNPSELPDRSVYQTILEPYTKVEIITPTKYLGGILELIKDKRGIYKNTSYLDTDRVLLTNEIPLAEIIIDFFDSLKSISSGYASMSYELLDYRADDLVKLDVLVAGDKVEALSNIVHEKKAVSVGIDITKRLKDLIPRAQFPIPLQAGIGARIIARETIPAYRKDVTGYLYGGDVSRKKKLLEKQKKGKKRMKQIGKIAISQEAFLAVLKRG